MARIAGVDLPRNKRIDVALTYIYGIGWNRSRSTLIGTRIDPTIRVHDLEDEQVARIRLYIDENYKVEGALRAEVAGSIKRLIEIKCWRGIRHKSGMPVRGQRTRDNSRTRKGPRPRIGGRKK